MLTEIWTQALGDRGGIPCPFLKIEKSALILQNFPICVHAVLRLSWRKNT